MIRHYLTVIAVATALLATTGLPIAGAHWRGNDVPAWDSPHEHQTVAPGIVTTVVFSTEAQRLCIDTTTLVISWSDPSNGACVGRTPIPPLRGFSNFQNQCNDLDSIGHPSYLKTAVRTTGGIGSVTLDWGATSTGPGSATPSASFSDFFAHPDASAGRAGWQANPTGASVPFFPGYSAVPGSVQVSITSTGQGTTSNPIVGGSTFPGVDFGDNDLEFCAGGASLTYAIDSGVDRWVANGAAPASGSPVVGPGAGFGLNDIRAVGGDGVYDITAVSSPVVDTGDTIPSTSASPRGILLSPTAVAPVSYSVCNDVGQSGCTNIPDAGSALRYGNGVDGDATYASLQDCVWMPAASSVVHGTSGLAYRGVASEWGAQTPSGFSCWPERLSRVSATPGTLYFPSSQATLTATGTAQWRPDHLPATPRAVESLTVWVDELAVLPFNRLNSGCADGTTFTPTAPFCPGGPTVDPPTAWVRVPSALAANVAVFQAP